MATATAQTPIPTKKDFKSYVKCALALMYVKPVLETLVDTEITQFHNQLLKLAQARKTHQCSCSWKTFLPICSSYRNKGTWNCKTHAQNVQTKRHSSCIVCTAIITEICLNHRFRGPSWKNADPQKWCSDAFQIAKCYMPLDGYISKTSLTETDFNGVLSVIINNTVFQKKIKDNLDDINNICSQARTIGRYFRHSPDFLMSENDLTTYIDVFISLLSDPIYFATDRKALEAVEKLKQLKDNSFIIIEDDLIKVLKDIIHELTAEKMKIFEQKIVAELNTFKNATIDEIKHLIQQNEKSKGTSMKSYERERMSIFRKMKSFLMDKPCSKDLKNDLISYYNELESKVKISHSLNSYEVPLEVVKTLSSFTPYKIVSDNHRIVKYMDILSELQTSKYEYIFVSAEAGMGKTSLMHRIAMTWCMAHSPETKRQDSIKLDEIEIMKKFGFLFLLHLRDYHGEKSCNIKDLISTQVSKRVCKEKNYETILQQILRTERVLVLLDGLDEWTHPDNNCDSKTQDMPHRHELTLQNCTVVLTTRPRKSSFTRHNTNDLHVRICMLDDESAQKLDQNVIDLFNQTENKKRINDFEKTALSTVTDDIKYIPYIRLQMILLWLNNQSLGQSQCELYGKIIEQTLKRGLKPEEIYRPRPSLEDQFLQLPECIKWNEMCSQNVRLLYGLGKEAFRSSFRANNIPTYNIDTKQLLTHLKEEELDFCLDVGLLSQTKHAFHNDVYFQQKIIHEFCSALYVSLEKDSQQREILDVCSSMSAIIDKSSFFIFLCGMNSACYSCIWEQLQQVVEKASSTTDLKLDEKAIRDLLFSYQSLQISCFRENHSFAVYLQEVVLAEHQMKPDYVTDLYTILGCNKRKVKSLYIYGNNDSDDIGRFFANVGPDALKRLETLYIDVQDELDNILSDVLPKSFGILKRLYIRNMLVDNQIANIINLVNLQIINLCHIGISHSALKSFLCEIGEKMTMISQLTLILDKCDDCVERSCSGLPLNFSKNIKIRVLHLSNVPICELHINTSCLEECVVTTDLGLHRISLQHKNITKLFESFQNGLVIRDLTLMNIECSEHRDCPGIVLNLSNLKQMKWLNIESSRVSEIHFNISCLEDCCIKNVLLSKSNLNQVYALVCHMSQLKTLHLENIRYVKHTKSKIGCTLNLLSLSQLQKLYLKYIPVSELRISTKRLEECEISSLCLHSNGKFTQANESKQDQLIVKQTENYSYSVKLKHKNHGTKLKKLSIKDMPLTEVSVHTKNLRKLKLNSTCSLKRDKMQKLYSKISKGEMLRQLDLENLVSQDDLGGKTELDLSKLSQLCKVNLRRVVLNDLKVNFELIQECEIYLENDLSSRIIQQLYDSIRSGKMLKKLYLRKISCSEDRKELTVTLNISNLEQLEMLHIENTYMNDFRLSIQNLADFKIIGSFFLPHKTIRQFYDNIENAKKLKHLHMDSISCLEHREDCPNIVCNVKLSKQLETLHLECLPVSVLYFNIDVKEVCITNLALSHRSIEQVYDMFTLAKIITKLELRSISEEQLYQTNRPLDLSQLKRLQILRLVNISVSQVRLNTDCIKKCELSILSVPHDTLKDIYDSICKANVLKELILNNITCDEHSTNCDGMPLNLIQKLQILQLGKIPVSRFRVNIDYAEKYELSSLLVSHDTLQDIYDSVRQETVLKELILNNLTCSEHSSKCNGLPLNLNAKHILQKLCLVGIPVSQLVVEPNCLREVELSVYGAIQDDDLNDLCHSLSKGKMMHKFKRTN